MVANLILGKYELIRELGSGGTAAVYLARDTVILRYVAIKCMSLDGGVARPQTRAASFPQFAGNSQVFVLPWEDSNDAYARFARTNPTKVQGQNVPNIPQAQTQALGLDDMFATNPIQSGDIARGYNNDAQGSANAGQVLGLDEARAVAKLVDENIVTLYDFGVENNMAYLVMEYVEGITLTKLLARYDDQLTLDTIAAIFDSVAHALELAHKNNVLHLDVKPDNILINPQGQVKVTDFGLASIMDLRGVGHAGGGTIGYMPPEQMRQKDLDARCDEWAFASIVYQMLVGKNPFMVPVNGALTQEDLNRAESAIYETELVLPSLLWDELDAEADDVLFRALDPDCEERYRNVAQFADEMAPFLGDPDAGYEDLRELLSLQDFEFEPSTGSADFLGVGAVAAAGGALAGGLSDGSAREPLTEQQKRRGFFKKRRTRHQNDDDDFEYGSEAASMRRAQRQEQRRQKQAAADDDWYAKQLSSAEQKNAAKHPVRQLKSETSFALLGRVFSALGSAFVACVALVNFPSIGSLSNPWVWPLLIAFAAGGLLLPSVGAGAAFVTLGVALCMNNSAVLGVLLVLSAVAWWFFCARFGKSRSNTALTFVVAGAFGFAQLAPLLTGFCLRLRDALITVLFGILLALTMAGFGSSDLLSWNVLSYFHIHTASVQSCVFNMLLLPQTWCIIASWLLTTIVVALGCAPRNRILAGMACVLGLVVLVVGLGAAEWFISAQTQMFPPLDMLIPTLISGVVVIAAGFTAVPERSRNA